MESSNQTIEYPSRGSVRDRNEPSIWNQDNQVEHSGQKHPTSSQVLFTQEYFDFIMVPYKSRIKEAPSKSITLMNRWGRRLAAYMEWWKLGTGVFLSLYACHVSKNPPSNNLLSVSLFTFSHYNPCKEYIFIALSGIISYIYNWNKSFAKITLCLLPKMCFWLYNASLFTHSQTHLKSQKDNIPFWIESNGNHCALFNWSQFKPVNQRSKE